MSKRPGVLEALRLWKANRKSRGLNPNSLKAPIGPEILPAYSKTAGPAPFCLSLVGFATGTAVLPDDFDTLPKSSAALKAHVRPDGAVYLGAFEFAGDDAGVIMVFGDPGTTLPDAMEYARRFRRQLSTQMDTFDAAKSLGPFALSQPSEPT